MTALELPAAFELELLDEIPDLRAVARQRARAGAPEGTLLVAGEQQSAVARAGKTWQSYPDNLHVAVILEPEVPQSRYHELLIVGLISMGQAISLHVSPLTALTFSWPNDINIARNKIASMWIDFGGGESGERPWIVLTTSVNIAHGPDDFSIPAMSLHEAEGNKEIDRDTLLVSWAKMLVVELNDWDTKGFQPKLYFWKTRLDNENRTVSIRSGQERGEAILLDVDDDGAGVVAVAGSGENGERRTLPLIRFMSEASHSE